MARIYSIHLILPFSIKRIPNNASTHYTYNIHQTVYTTPKTKKGFARKPIAQRKTIKNTRPLPVARQVTKPVATPKPQKQRNKFRKNINKHVLAAYFDNDVKLSRAAAIEQWRNAVIAELDAADKIKAQNTFNLQADIEHRYNVLEIEHIDYSVIFTMAQDDVKKMAAAFDRLAMEPKYSIYDEYDIYTDDDLYIAIDANHLIDQSDKTILDIDDSKLFGPYTQEANLKIQEEENTSWQTDNAPSAEINESVVNHFINKYAGADTNAAMRAFEKQKSHSTGLPYILHKMQITK